MYPLCLGSGTDFQALREFLTGAGYTEARICERVGIDSIFSFRALFENRQTCVATNDALDLLIHLLMDGETVDEAQVRALLPEAGIDVLMRLGVLARLPRDASKIAAMAWLYPVGELYLTSDRTTPVDHDKTVSLPEDVVYAAITSNTRRFLRTLPAAPCGRLLELCAGTGIAALIAARDYAREAWACDITQRCVSCAEFNTRLNGIRNLHNLRGDLFEPVQGMTFDRIVAHPPYVPGYGRDEHLYFRDGGDDGEQILRRIVQGLPEFLAPGGRLYAVTLGTDRKGEMFEQRVRRWLGAAAEEFDVVLVATRVEDRAPEEFVNTMIRRNGLGKYIGPVQKLYEELQVTATYYGAVIVQRRAEARPAATLRLNKEPDAWSDVMEWSVAAAAGFATPEAKLALLEQRPKMLPDIRLSVLHTPQDGVLQASEFKLRSGWPLAVEGVCPPWLAMVLGQCNGERTGQELFEAALRDDLIQPSTSRLEFATNLFALVSNGFVEVSSHPLPRRRNGAGL